MSTLAGSTYSGSVDNIGSNAQFNSPTGLVVDLGSGDIYVSDHINNNIRKISMPGGAHVELFYYYCTQF